MKYARNNLNLNKDYSANETVKYGINYRSIQS